MLLNLIQSQGASKQNCISLRSYIKITERGVQVCPPFAVQIGLKEDENFAAAEVAKAIKSIKFGKAADENNIRIEMLKTLNGKGTL